MKACGRRLASREAIADTVELTMPVIAMTRWSGLGRLRTKVVARDDDGRWCG